MNMNVTHVSEQCETAFLKQEHAIIGISPFNSYFSQEKIAELYKFANSQFSQVQLYIPDAPTKYTLMALGYEEAKARKKAHRQCSGLKNKARKALIACGVDESELGDYLISHDRLEQSETYLEKRVFIGDLFESNPEFRQGCMESSKWVLSNHMKDEEEICEKKLSMAVKYFLDELPMFLWTPQIQKVSASSFFYHQCPEFLKKIFNGEFANELNREGQGFSIITAGVAH